jgi:hypothetical protein
MNIEVIRSSIVSLAEYVCFDARDPVLTFPTVHSVFIVYIPLYSR